MVGGRCLQQGHWGEEGGGVKKKEEGQQEKEGGWAGGVDHETVTALQRESSSWPKWPSG